jgi:transposase
MGNKRTKYTKEFKAEAVKLVKEQGYTQAEASRNLGLRDNMLSRWIAESEKSTGKLNSKVKGKLTTEQEELGKLRLEIKRLKMERDILKKAATFFANESA